MITDFYVYIHHRPDGSPFYVGKGSNGRAKLLSDRNPHHRNIVKKYGRENITISILPCQSEQGSFSTEIGLIKSFRQLGFELSNKTDGGEGISGLIHSESAKARMSAARMGNQINVGRKQSAETIAKKSAALKGKTAWNKGKKLGPISDEHRAKISAANKGNKHGLGTKRVAWNKGKRAIDARFEVAVRRAERVGRR